MECMLLLVSRDSVAFVSFVFGGKVEKLGEKKEQAKERVCGREMSLELKTAVSVSTRELVWISAFF